MDFGKKLREFVQEAAHLCLPFIPPTPAQLERRLKKIQDQIKKIPEGIELLSLMERKKAQLIFSRDANIAAHSCNIKFEKGKCSALRGTDFILLNPDREDHELVASFFHETRHLQQSIKHLRRPHGKHISPADLAWYVRALEADAQAEATLIALKSKRGGNPLLMEANDEHGYTRMCRVAEREYARDPASLDDGRLKRMVFDTWFSETGFQVKDIYDRSVLEEEWPDSPYRKDMSEYGFVKTSLTAEDIQKLGTVGGEKINYLTLPGFRPLDDLYYREGFSDLNKQKLAPLMKEWEKPIVPPAKKPSERGLGA